MSLVLGYLNKLVIEMAFLVQVKPVSNGDVIYSSLLSEAYKLHCAGKYRRGAPGISSWNMSVKPSRCI